MPAPISHFAINADDVERARTFYSRALGWTFSAWGPPGFFHIDTGSTEPGHPIGALQQRRDLAEGGPTIGYECTVAVEDVQELTKRVSELGGRVLMEPTVIAGVGELTFIEDTERNVFGAMRYDSHAE